MNTGRTPYSLASWARHIAGAMTLIDLRGEDQFSRPLGRRLFQQLRYQIVRQSHCTGKRANSLTSFRSLGVLSVESVPLRT